VSMFALLYGSQEDISDVVEYARQRGIRVVVEFDIPGHAQSWCVGYPEVCPSAECTTPLDVSAPHTYELMNSVFAEATGNVSGGGLFPDNYFHVGGDEVNTTCWSSTPHIASWLASKNLTAEQGYLYIVEQAHGMVHAQGRQPINWEEVFNHFGSALDPSTIIQIWLDHATLARVVAAGYRGILSNSDGWYLAARLDVPWQSFYLNEPFENITDPTQQSLVLGGEVCEWGETVDTSDLFNTVWPRSAAAAERLWSPADLIDLDAALIRLERFRCLLNSRGIDSAPVQVHARQPPDTPGSCYVQ
jgi:hexosaminidase